MQCLPGFMIVDFFSVYHHNACICLINTGKNFHQCAFACTVFTNQAKDLTLAKCKFPIGESMNTTERFLDAFHADADELVWSKPRRIANGIMMNKPLVTSKGEWLFPCAIWCDTSGSVPSERHGLENEQFSNVYASTDCGKTITLRGHADIPGRSFDEHMLVEKKDGALWMLVRTFKGIGESFSTDGGYTWTPGRNSHIDGPCSRFFIRRLKSGRLLMINHYNFDQRIDLDDIMNQGNVKSWKGRSHLTAMLSEDDGETWPYTLLLDERNEVSYPDAKEADNGYIYVTYDWERVTQREILMARFTEDDILRGKILSPEGKLRVLVNKALGQPDIH